jgi:hypothetical protein
MVYKDAEKLYGEVRVVTEALVQKALHGLYPTSLPLSPAATVHASRLLTVFAHNTMPFPWRDIVRVPFTEGRTSSGKVLQMTSDGKEGYVILEGGVGGGLVLPSQISPKDLSAAQAFSRSLSLTQQRTCQHSPHIIWTSSLMQHGRSSRSRASLPGIF